MKLLFAILATMSLLTSITFSCSAYILETIDYRWRKDNGNEKTAHWQADLNKPIKISKATMNDVIRLRMGYFNSLLDGSSGASNKISGLLLCDSVVVTNDTSTTAPFVLVTSPNVHHGQLTTRQITNYSREIYMPGRILTHATDSTMTIKVNYGTEIEWVLKPTRHLKPSSTYKFKLKNAVSSDAAEYGTAILTTDFDISPPPADSLVSLTLHPNNNEVVVRWQTALSNHKKFQIERSNNGFTYRDEGLPIEGGVGKHYETVRPLPSDTGKYYIRLKLYDQNNKMTVTKPYAFTIRRHFQISDVDARWASYPNYIRITYITSAEHYIDHLDFLISKGDIRDSSSYRHIQRSNFNNTYYKNTETIRVIEYPMDQEKFHIALVSDDKVLYVKNFFVPFPNKNNNAAITVYPNPANSGMVSFDLKDYNGKNLTATLTNLNGKQVSKQTFKVNASQKYALNSAAKPGMYVLNVTGEGLSKSAKVLVE